MHRMLVIGVLIVLAGMALVSIGSFGQSSTSGGGFVFIGPFPIVFGSGPSGWWLALLSVVIGVVMIALVLIWGSHVLASREG